LAYAYAITPAWRAGGSYGTSFTAPSFNELYFPGFGNPDLLPEEGRHGELFAMWAAGPHKVRLTAYRHRYVLFISSGPQPSNIPKVEIDGLTLSWDARFDDIWLTASYDHVDPRNASVGSADFGNLLQRRAQQAFKANADWQFGAFKLGAALQAYSHRFDDTANTIRLAGYGVLDLSADWALARDWSLGLRLNNLPGKVYETAFGYNQPWREGFVTLRWTTR
jgi:vitamin B12 transporter